MNNNFSILQYSMLYVQTINMGDTGWSYERCNRRTTEKIIAVFLLSCTIAMETYTNYVCVGLAEYSV